MGIWDFSVREYVLLFTALLVAREEIPFDFPRKIKNPETSEDFPKAKLELGKLAILVLRCYVGKRSSKTKRKDEDAIAFLAISKLLRCAHNPEVVGSNPAPAPTRKALSFQ